jgi:hypothetical protein
MDLKGERKSLDEALAKVVQISIISLIIDMPY